MADRLPLGILGRTLRRMLSSHRDGLHVRGEGWEAKPPLLIYQMGKVGSRSIFAAIDGGGLPYSVFHIHWLSLQGIEFSERIFQNAGADIPENLHVSRRLREDLDRWPVPKLRVITVARDPVRRKISDFFQGIGVWSPDCRNAAGRIDGAKVVESLQTLFDQFDESVDSTCSWFDAEFKRALGIDIYAQPFDVTAGFSTISCGNVEVLILRFEDLARSFRAALEQFLGSSQFLPLDVVNATRKKENGEAYQYVQRNLKLPETALRKIYSSKYANHFHYDRTTGGQFA